MERRSFAGSTSGRFLSCPGRHISPPARQQASGQNAAGHMESGSAAQGQSLTGAEAKSQAGKAGWHNAGGGRSLAAWRARRADRRRTLLLHRAALMRLTEE
jgi:hypothetical protein